MPSKSKQPQIPLPKSWGTHVKTAILHVVALAQYALTYSRSWAVDSTNQRVRLKAENDHLQQDLALRQEELRIKDARMRRMAPARRPHYPPTERMAILELRAARAWSLEQTARTFLVTADTIRSWVRRIDEAGDKALVQTSLPVNLSSPVGEQNVAFAKNFETFGAVSRRKSFAVGCRVSFWLLQAVVVKTLRFVGRA